MSEYRVNQSHFELIRHRLLLSENRLMNEPNAPQNGRSVTQNFGQHIPPQPMQLGLLRRAVALTAKGIVAALGEFLLPAV